MQLSLSEDIEEFTKLFNQLKSDTAKLKTAVASVSGGNEEYKKISDSVDRALKDMKNVKEFGPKGKNVRKNVNDLKARVEAVSGALNTKRTALDRAVLDAMKYEQGGFDEIEDLSRLDIESSPAMLTSKNDAQKRARIVQHYNTLTRQFEPQKREMEQQIRDGQTALKKVKDVEGKLFRQWLIFRKQTGSKEPRIPSLRDASLVPIFEQGFEPQAFTASERTATEFFEAVGDAILPADDYMTFDDLCAGTGKPSNLTNAQKTPYYYSNPSNPVSILLKHSAGSGKTAAMTLANSLFVRAGYLPIIVTTEALASEKTYEEATFLQCADWNIQQMMALNKCDTFVQLVEQLHADPTLDDVYAQGKAWYGAMARGAWNKALKLTFRQFTNLCVSYLKSVQYRADNAHPRIAEDASKILRGRAPLAKDDKSAGPRHKVFHKTVILMDEVHSMMNEPPPKDTKQGGLDQAALGDIRTVIKAMWQAREESPGEGPVVIAASATPGLDGFEFVMILNLLCEQNDGYPFDATAGLYRTAEDNYLNQKERLKTTFKALHPQFEELARRMAYGHVSYYDSGGSRSVPAMRPLKCEVVLTNAQGEDQDKAIKELNKKGVHLVEAEDGTWFVETEFEHRYNRKVQRNDPTTIQNFIMSLKRNAISAKKYYVDGVKVINRSESKSVPALKSYDDVAKWERNAQLISPLYYETIQLIKKNKGLGVRKQYVYINLKETRESVVGITLFCNMLDSLLRYEDVNDTERDKSTLPEGVYGKLAISDFPTDAERKKLQDVLSKFNSPANRNGSVIDVIVLDPSYKEGISLVGVGVVYIVGIVDSESDLVQSVARAFRNCRTNPAELRPTQDVPVYLMMPYAEGADVYKIIKGVQSHDDEVQRIADVCRDCAFDKKVLRDENERAEENRGQLRRASGIGL